MTPFPFKGKGWGWVILLAIQFTKYDVGNPTPSKELNKCFLLFDTNRTLLLSLTKVMSPSLGVGCAYVSLHYKKLNYIKLIHGAAMITHRRRKSYAEQREILR